MALLTIHDVNDYVLAFGPKRLTPPTTRALSVASLDTRSRAFTCRISIVYWIIPDVGVEVHLILVANGIGLEEPP